MIIILDAGHGVETPGKRSPVYNGNQLFEWEFNRDIVMRIVRMLHHAGYGEQVKCGIVSHDTPLRERVKLINEIPGDKVLVSIHANAGGGTGFEAFTYHGESASDKYATIICEEFQKEFPHERLRSDFSDGDPDKEAAFYILKHTNCPAVLTENFFMDNPRDCAMLKDYDVRERIAMFHTRAILRILIK